MPQLHIGIDVLHSHDVIMAMQAADIRSDNGGIVGACVINGIWQRSSVAYGKRQLHRLALTAISYNALQRINHYNIKTLRLA